LALQREKTTQTSSKVEIMKKLDEASGYIPKNEKEAADPRWQMAITNDIKPGETQRQAKKMGWATDKQGQPLKLKANGKIDESMMNVSVQSRSPISPGARGLLHARSNFKEVLHRNNQIVNSSAADALAWELSKPVDLRETVGQVAQRFNMPANSLENVFKENYGMTVVEFARKALKDYHTKPKKI
jgi:AraC-like DNA-binding protein